MSRTTTTIDMVHQGEVRQIGGEVLEMISVIAIDVVLVMVAM